MKKRVLKKTFLLLTILGLASFNMNAQTHDQTFSDNASFQKYNIGYGAGTRSHEVGGVNASYDGVTHDGAFKLLRDGNNNANIGFNEGINADTYKFIKIVYKNETVATNIRIQGKNDGGTPDDAPSDISISGNNTTIFSGTGNWETVYINLSNEATWANNVHDLDILVKSTDPSTDSGTDNAINDTGAFYIDSIEFLTSLPGIATTFADFIGAEAADDANVGVIDPDVTGNSTVTGWRFQSSGVQSFSSAQVYEGDYSIKLIDDGTNSGYTGWFYSGRTQDTEPVAAKITLANTDTHLAILNVFIESGTAGTLRCRIDTGGDLTNLDWDLSGLETGKWHRIAKEIEPTFLSTNEVIAWNFQNPASGSSVVYIDGLELLSETNSEYIATTNTNASWSGAGAWPNDTQPTATDIVYIGNNFNVWSDGEVAKEVFVKDGVSFRFRHQTSGLTTEKLHLNTASLTLEADGCSLIVTDEFTGNSNITYTRTLTADPLATKAWHSVSSPVSGQTVANFMANHTLASGTAISSNRGIATYNNATPGFSYYQDGYAGADSFDNKGYIVKLAAAGDVSFTGGYNLGDVDFSISQGAGDHYNLVGNPKTAYVNVGTFFADNNAANRLSENTLYIWDPANDVYEPKLSGDNADFNIAPGQAFFVKAGTASNNKVTFTNANQSHQNDTFLKSDAKTEIFLNVTQGKVKNRTKVNYIAGATKGFDNGFDGSMFSAHNYKLAVFSQIVENNLEKDLAVQSLPKADLESSIVALGMIAEANKEITFSAEALNLPSDAKVYLEDRFTNTFTRLDEANAEYKVTLTEAINGVGRFYLHTSQSALSVDETIQLNSVNVFKINTSTLRISGLPQGKASVSLFNILGKQVLSTSFEANGSNDISLPKLATGVYIIKMQTATSKISKKIILE